MNPFRYRPSAPDLDVDHDGETVDDWADNPLSNALAWASVNTTPKWCQDETHWSNKIADYLFTTCPCCMMFRGIIIGAALSSILWLIICLAAVMLF